MIKNNSKYNDIRKSLAAIESDCDLLVEERKLAKFHQDWRKMRDLRLKIYRNLCKIGQLRCDLVEELRK